MESSKHYKMFKKGKNWCTMALTTAAIVAGVAFTITANADSVDNTNVNATSVKADDNTASMASLNTTNTEESIDAEQNQEVDTQDVERNDETANQQAVVNTKTTNAYNVNNESIQTPVDNNSVNVSLVQNNKEDGWNGNQYYQNGQAVKNNTLDIDGQTYYFDADGNMVKDYFLNKDGHDFYFNNDGQMVKDYFLNRWGATYYYDNNGYRYTDQFMNRWGANYYFGTDGVRYTNQFFSRWGATYYYGDGGVRYTDQFMNRWGANYYFGMDGARYTNQFLNRWGANYYFGSDGALVRNTTLNINGKTYVANNDGVLTENDAASKADLALTMLGTPYVWGGNQPGGFDCSGLVQWAFGLGSNYRTTYQQTNLGTHQYNVYSAPKGSLVFFGSDSSPYHVGISLGDGTFVHAPEPGDVVKITKMRYYTPSYYIVLN